MSSLTFVNESITFIESFNDVVEATNETIRGLSRAMEAAEEKINLAESGAALFATTLGLINSRISKATAEVNDSIKSIMSISNVSSQFNSTKTQVEDLAESLRISTDYVDRAAAAYNRFRKQIDDAAPVYSDATTRFNIAYHSLAELLMGFDDSIGDSQETVISFQEEVDKAMSKLAAMQRLTVEETVETAEEELGPDTAAGVEQFPEGFDLSLGISGKGKRGPQSIPPTSPPKTKRSRQRSPILDEESTQRPTLPETSRSAASISGFSPRTPSARPTWLPKILRTTASAATQTSPTATSAQTQFLTAQPPFITAQPPFTTVQPFYTTTPNPFTTPSQTPAESSSTQAFTESLTPTQTLTTEPLTTAQVTGLQSPAIAEPEWETVEL